MEKTFLLLDDLLDLIYHFVVMNLKVKYQFNCHLSYYCSESCVFSIDNLKKLFSPGYTQVRNTHDKDTVCTTLFHCCAASYSGSSSRSTIGRVSVLCFRLEIAPQWSFPVSEEVRRTEYEFEPSFSLLW